MICKANSSGVRPAAAAALAIARDFSVAYPGFRPDPGRLPPCPFATWLTLVISNSAHLKSSLQPQHYRLSGFRLSGFRLSSIGIGMELDLSRHRGQLLH